MTMLLDSMRQAWRPCHDCACRVLDDNPITQRLLGLCPLIAVSDTVSKALSMSVLFGAILVVCGALAAMLRHTVSWRLKPMYHTLLAALVTACVIAVAKTISFEAVTDLGIYASLIAANCFVLSTIQEVAERESIGNTLRRAAADASFIIFFLTLFASARELLAYGSWAQSRDELFVAGPLPFVASAPGALLCLALVSAGINAARNRDEKLGVALKAAPEITENRNGA